MNSLSVLTVDDEVPSLDELSFLLGCCDNVGSVKVARSTTEALRLLQDHHFDVVLLDIRMPGLDGIELAKVIGRFARPPAVVFVTAHEEYALEAFEGGASGYLLKPVDLRQLVQVLDRIAGQRETQERDDEPFDVLAAETGSATTLVTRNEVSWVEAAGDYVRLHIKDGTAHLVRVPISVLEEEWASHGFTRIHRSYLVAIREIRELHSDGSQMTVRVRDQDLPVSRRHVHQLRERLVRHTRRPAS